MGCVLNGHLSRYVLILMLLVHGRPAFPAPTPTDCGVNSTKGLTAQVKDEVNKTLVLYNEKHGVKSGSDRYDVPTSSVSGTNISEKLQDIYIKNVIFISHISRVREYQPALLTNPQSLNDSLSQVKGSLNYHSERMKAILIRINSLPTTAAPPQPSPGDDYDIKQYGLAVLVSLRDWLIEVEKVLTEATSVCDN